MDEEVNSMGSFGGFYKGEKKKQKQKKNDNKNNNVQVNTYSPEPFVLPEVISKKKPGE